MHTIFNNHQIIAVDCDEVLTEMIEYSLQHSKGKVTEVFSKKEEITNYYIVNASKEVDRNDVVEFFRQSFECDQNALEVPIVEGSFEVLSKLKKQGKRLFVVTARPRILEDYTRRYIQKHFPGIFTDIHFGEHFTTNHRNKSEICKEIGATLLIDDSMEYVLDCAQNGVETILLEKPWNKNRKETHKNIHKIHHWNDLLVQ